jgi:carbon storage regulator
MLVLNRRRGEAIVLDGGIRIVVLDSDNRGARIGIEAPRETRIQREELVDPGGGSQGLGDREATAADPPEPTVEGS